jgi:hypothetical protein
VGLSLLSGTSATSAKVGSVGKGSQGFLNSCDEQLNIAFGAGRIRIMTGYGIFGGLIELRVPQGEGHFLALIGKSKKLSIPTYPVRLIREVAKPSSHN